jgi:hypothetical protein
MVGGQPAHVVSVAGNDVEITEKLASSVGGYTVRLSDGTIRQGKITGQPSGTVVTLDNASGIGPDDLIVVGEADRVVKPYIVSQISPSMDLTATLTLLPYVAQVYDADIGALPEWNPEISNDLINASNLEVIFVKASEQNMVYVNRYPFGNFVITWGVNNENLVANYDLVIKTADGQQEIVTKLIRPYYEYSVDLVNEMSKYGEVIFEVIPYTAGGIAGKSGFATSLIYPDRTAPAPVNWFLVNVQDMNIALSWEPPKELDIQEYEVRYSPKVEFANWNASQLIGVFSYNVTRTMVGARTGTYGICVRDTSGNLSEVTGRRTTIEQLPNINLIETINDAPLWDGTLSGVVKESSKIQSAGDFGSVFPEGFYYYKAILLTV